MTRPLAENEHLFTSESVTEGHPDKVSDQISDGVLDAVMAEDPGGRVAWRRHSKRECRAGGRSSRRRSGEVFFRRGRSRRV